MSQHNNKAQLVKLVFLPLYMMKFYPNNRFVRKLFMIIIWHVMVHILCMFPKRIECLINYLEKRMKNQHVLLGSVRSISKGTMYNSSR